MTELHRIRSKQVKSCLAVQIPEEVLQHIFLFLSPCEGFFLDSEPGYPYFGLGPYTSGPTKLFSVALVCWHWHYAAFPLVYSHVRIMAFNSLERFCKTLTKSPKIASAIRTFSNSTDYFPTNWRSYKDASLVMNIRFEKAISSLCKVLPVTSKMDLEISASSLTRLAASLSQSRAALTSLHIALDIRRPKNPELPSGMRFPHLQSLTLEHYNFSHQIIWPDMPHLHCLRIVRSYVHGAHVKLFAGLPPLARVELIRMKFASGDCRDMLAPGELEVGIQDLIFYESPSPNNTLFPFPSTNHYASLRRLTLAAPNWPVIGIPTNPLLNLEVLTIMPLPSCVGSWPGSDLTFGGLCSFLTKVHLTPSLKLLRIGCWSDKWVTSEMYRLQEVLEERSLHVEVRMIDGKCTSLLC